MSGRGALGRISPRWWVGGGIVLLLGALAFIGGFVPGASPERENATGPVAPEVSLPTAGGEFTLGEHRGRVVVLDFLAPG